ncbi:MAG: MMPL family transporter [Cuniculiplasma sp.]
MFESIFERIGKGVSKNSGKIIVIWIVLVVLMGYGALLVFSHTSFNITGGLGSSKTMSANATTEISKYFSPAAAGLSTKSSELIIVAQNITVTSSAGMTALINFQNNMGSYLKTVKNYTGSENLISTERDALRSFTTGMNKLMDENYKITKSTNGLESAVNASSGLFLSTEEGYIESFNAAYNKTLNISQSELSAYNQIKSALNLTNPAKDHYKSLQISYLNAFSSNVNKTLSKNNLSSLNLIVQNSSKMTLSNSNFTAKFNLCERNNSGLPSLSIVRGVIGHQNLTQYEKNPSIANVDVSIGLLKSEPGNSSIKGQDLITKTDNVSLEKFALVSYNLSQPATSLQIDSVSTFLTKMAAEKEFNGNPLFSVNPETISAYLNYARNSTSVNSTVETFMESYSLFQLPLIPTNYLLHNFVGYNKSTSIFIYKFKGNYSSKVGVKVSSIAHNVSSSFTGSKFLIAGSNELASQLSKEVSSGLIRALGAGILLSILIVGLFFRSVKAAFLPILMFMVSTVVSLGVIGYLYTFVLHTEASFITPTLLLIFVLGLSSDYTVYIMARYRSELRKKTERPTVISARWAGHAVFTSGLTVILSEVVLWLAHIPFFSDSGFANAIGVTVTLIAANTLLLSILHRYGKSIFKKTASGEFHEGSHRHMHNIGLFSTKHKKTMIAVFVVVAIIGLTVYEVTPSGIDILKLLPKSPATTAIQVVNNSFNGDFFDRDFEIVQLPHPLISNGTVNTAEMSTVYAIENTTLHTKGISEVLGPGRPYGYYTGYIPTNISSAQVGTYVSQSNTFISTSNPRYVEIVFQTYNIGWGNKAIATVTTLYKNVSTIPNTPSTYSVAVGGLSQILSNALHTTQVSFSELLPILSITIFIILLIQLSSILTPLRLVIMVMAAVLASLAVTYVIFHYLQGFPVVIFMPVFVFITLLAVGLDYDIFMITRVREEVMKGEGLRDAIVTSVTENGGVIMLLGTLLFVTFAALYFSAIPLIQEIGIGVGLGVLIDTFISWPFFIPAVMSIIKKYNWWPSKLQDKP